MPVAICDLDAVDDGVPALDRATLPSTYLLPTGDRTLRPAWTARAWEVPGASHSFYAAVPERTAVLVDTAAR